jgi:hypothetical protein
MKSTIEAAPLAAARINIGSKPVSMVQKNPNAEICEEKIAAVSAAQRLYPTTRNKSALKRIIHS